MQTKEIDKEFDETFHKNVWGKYQMGTDTKPDIGNPIGGYTEISSDIKSFLHRIIKEERESVKKEFARNLKKNL
jgi:hypothetical protein